MKLFLSILLPFLTGGECALAIFAAYALRHLTSDAQPTFDAEARQGGGTSTPNCPAWRPCQCHNMPVCTDSAGLTDFTERLDCLDLGYTCAATKTQPAPKNGSPPLLTPGGTTNASCTKDCECWLRCPWSPVDPV